MRKIFNKIAVILATSSLVLPLTACVFNFYINSATSTVIKSFTDQTSSVLKALVMSKEKNADTSQTIQDILKQFPNSSIENQTNNISLSSWDQFKESWGFNKNINISGFNPADPNEGYFVPTGQGPITQQVNNYRSANNILTQANLILGLNVANNQLVYNLIKDGDIRNTIVGFLNETKVSDPNQASTIIKLLKNIVIGTDWNNPNQNAFSDIIINPITSLLNYLVQGLWTSNQSTPTDTTALNSFMSTWADIDNEPYSQWSDGTNWSLSTTQYENWNQNDFNFYRSGVLINHLFYQISKDYKIAKPDTEYTNPRYLGNILTDHITGGLIPDIDIDGIQNDILQYLPHLLENPSYIITIVEAVVPIIKQWGLEMSNITQGAKNLTFGKIYPSNDNANSYNALDLLNNINYLIEHPGQPGQPGEPGTLKYVIESLIGLNPQGTVGNPFTYDIQVVALNNTYPIGQLFKISLIANKIRPLIDTIIELLNNIDLKNIFNNILNIYNKWIKQYDDINQGINFDLTKLQDFLLNNTNGLLTIIYQNTIPVLYEIMTNPNPITDSDDADYFNFYQSLGGQLPSTPGGMPPFNFVDNSVIKILQSKMANTNEPLGQLMLILLGNSSDGNNGIFSFVVESNNQWITDNYTKFFDVTNKSVGQVYDAVMSNRVENNILHTTLTYNFTYKINGKTYSFWARCISSDDQDNFNGTKNFTFTDIKLRSIR